MNIQVSRRSFMQGATASLAGTTLGALGFGDIEAAYAVDSCLEAREPNRNPQHLSILLGRLAASSCTRKAI